MATLIGRAASRLVGDCFKTRSSVYSFLNQSCTTHGRFRHQSSSFALNIPFTTSSKTKPLSTDPLLQILETEIGYARQADDQDQVEETPSGFPFKMEDKPGAKVVKLSRDYQGESVKVEVHMTNLVTGYKDSEEEEESGEEDHEDKPEKPMQSNMPLLVTLSKKTGPGLEFRCIAFPDRIVIKEMWIRFLDDPSRDVIAYEGPSFRDLDEKLRKAFHRYLEIRGINPSVINFLHGYMIDKDGREHLLWLKTLKNFVKS